MSALPHSSLGSVEFAGRGVHKQCQSGARSRVLVEGRSSHGAISPVFADRSYFGAQKRWNDSDASIISTLLLSWLQGLGCPIPFAVGNSHVLQIELI